VAGPGTDDEAVGMEIEKAMTAVRGTHQSVLTTLRRDGRPQLSNVVHAVDEQGVIRISTTADRAKHANLRRTPWAALHVNGDSFWSYAVVEADVTVSEVAGAPDDAAVDELVELFRAISGEHDDWDEYRAAMVAERRVVLRLHPTRAYGALR
jgi:PPOX class probable F420-dependent enzyme